MTRMIYAAALSVALAAPVAGQSPVAGVWQAEVARRVENINGEERASDIALVRYMLEVRGDSVFGTFRMVDAPADVPARTIRGTYRDGVLKLVAEPSQATIRTGDGGENRIQMIMEYDLEVDGDVISGTQQAHSTDGTIQSQQRPFKATRVKN